MGLHQPLESSVELTLEVFLSNQDSKANCRRAMQVTLMHPQIRKLLQEALPDRNSELREILMASESSCAGSCVDSAVVFTRQHQEGLSYVTGSRKTASTLKKWKRGENAMSPILSSRFDFGSKQSCSPVPQEYGHVRKQYVMLFLVLGDSLSEPYMDNTTVRKGVSTSFAACCPSLSCSV